MRIFAKMLVSMFRNSGFDDMRVLLKEVFVSQGGKSVKVEFYVHNVGDDEKKAVMECLNGIFLTTGAYVSEFEKKLSEYNGLSYSIGLMSCTAGLHLAQLALGIGPGDEVITTPMTFIATSTSIMHTGAIPVFVDVEASTGLINPASIEAAITPRTKAILPVHLYGQMCDMKAIRAIADRHGLKVIEDAAHCLEGQRDGVGPGQLSDAVSYSFYATKSITSGEGGAVSTRDADVGERVRLLRQHGMSKEAAARYSGNYQHWDMQALGYKCNMNNIQAALLLPQLDRVESIRESRHIRFERYQSLLRGIDGIELPTVLQDSKHGCHLITVWVDPGRRDAVLAKMGEEGIGVAVNYRAIHLLTFFKERFGFQRGQFPAAERIGDSTITLPLYASLPMESIDIVVDALKKAVHS